MTSDRWVTAVHEAGHAVAALELDGQCEGLVLNVDGGLAHVTVPCPDREAYMIAAGPTAQELAGKNAAPELQGPEKLGTTKALHPKEDFMFALSVELAEVPGSMRTLETDERRLAVWAIGGHESEPDSWARRIQFANYVAHKVVSANVEKIIRVAEQLFIHGHLSGDEVTGILAATEKKQ